MGPTCGLIAAFETKISMPPKFFMVSSNNRVLCFGCPTWHLTPIAFIPSLVKEFKALSILDSFLLLTTTFAP